MKHTVTARLRAMAIVVFLCIVPAGLCAEEPPAPAGDGRQNGLLQRIDFGNAHIMGQTITSGAVYLLHRKKSDIDSMLKVRQDYRSEIRREYGLEKTAPTGDNDTETDPTGSRGTN